MCKALNHLHNFSVRGFCFFVVNMHVFTILCRHVNIGPQYQADVASVASKFMSIYE